MSAADADRGFETHQFRKCATVIPEPISPGNLRMADQTTTTRPLGRPREERADRAILTAAIELIAAQGVRDLRMDDVADRARVGKATIYRRYRSKHELVTAAVSALVSEIAVPDSG